MNSVSEWKDFLRKNGLYSGDSSDSVNQEFRRGMVALNDIFSNISPSTNGVVWNNGKIGKRASIMDASLALGLVKKLGIADLDAIGKPTSDNRSNIFNQMFVSQDDSKLNNYDPKLNQNQGKWQNQVPVNDEVPESLGDEVPTKDSSIDNRMKMLMQLIEGQKN